MKRRGFTLIEVLVAIAIIAILASIIASVAKRAVTRAKVTTCQLNLKNIGQAMLLYDGAWGDYPCTSLSGPAIRPYIGRPLPVCSVATAHDKFGDYFIMQILRDRACLWSAPRNAWTRGDQRFL